MLCFIKKESGGSVIALSTMEKISPSEKNTGDERGIPMNGGGAGRKDAWSMASDVNTVPLGLSKVTSCISTMRVPGCDSGSIGNLTSVSNPEIPTVTTCANFCSL